MAHAARPGGGVPAVVGGGAARLGLADRLGQTAVQAAGGAKDVELEELSAGLQEQVAVVEARTKPLRELTAAAELPTGTT